MKERTEESSSMGVNAIEKRWLREGFRSRLHLLVFFPYVSFIFLLRSFFLCLLSLPIFLPLPSSLPNPFFLSIPSFNSQIFLPFPTFFPNFLPLPIPFFLLHLPSFPSFVTTSFPLLFSPLLLSSLIHSPSSSLLPSFFISLLAFLIPSSSSFFPP